MYVYTTCMYVRMFAYVCNYVQSVCVCMCTLRIRMFACMLLQVNSSLAFFLFSFHVHEKSILLSVM